MRRQQSAGRRWWWRGLAVVVFNERQFLAEHKGEGG